MFLFRENFSNKKMPNPIYTKGFDVLTIRIFKRRYSFIADLYYFPTNLFLDLIPCMKVDLLINNYLF